MRIFLLLLCALSFNVTEAQRGGGGMGGSRQGGGMGQSGGMQERKERPKYNASQVAGIFSYDDNEAIKKIKVKDEALTLNVRKAINEYNTNIQEIALLNKDNFDTLNVFMNTIMKSAMSSRRGQGQQNSGGGMQRGGSMQAGNDSQSDDSRDIMRNAMELSREKIRPVKQAVKQEEEKLNTKLKALLNEKQYKKWLKYQDDIKEDMQPEKPSNNNQGGQRQNQGGGGMGGRGGGGMR